MNQDRVKLHEQIAFEKWEGYAKPIERGRYVNFGDKYIMAPDFVMMSPLFNNGVPQSITDMFSGEVAEAVAKYAPDGDVLTPEWRMWWKHMPDYRLVSPFECVAGDWGFSPVIPTPGRFPTVRGSNCASTTISGSTRMGISLVGTGSSTPPSGRACCRSLGSTPTG